MPAEPRQLGTDKIEWFYQQLSVWAADNLRDFPWRRTSDPYAILVAEVLLQKTAATTAAPIYESLHGSVPNSGSPGSSVG